MKWNKLLKVVFSCFPLSSVERQQTDDHEGFPSWGNENMFDGQFDDGNDPSDVEGSDTLVSQPRQVGCCVFDLILVFPDKYKLQGL